LAAAGIVFLYLSFWAAFGLYRLLPEPAAFAWMALSTAAAGTQAVRYRSQAVALLGLAGGFATPLLLPNTGDAWFVLAYALLLCGGAVWLARRLGWRGTEPLAAAGSVVLYLSVGSHQAYLTGFLAAWFALFAASAGLVAFQAVEALAPMAVALLWAPAWSGLALALLLAAAGLAVAHWRGRPALAAGSFFGFWFAYAAWRSSAASPPIAPAMALLALGFLLYVAWAVRRAPLAILDLLIVALDAGLFFGAAYELLPPGYAGWLAIAAAIAEAALARLLWARDPRGGLLAAGVAWVLLLLAVPVQLAGWRVTMAWALEGAAVAWIGVRAGERRAAFAAVAAFVLVLARLAAADSRLYGSAAQYDALVNARFLTFAIAASSFGAAAWWMRRSRLARGLYIAAHGVLLWGLLLEAVGWAARTAPPAELRSVAGTAVSVVAAGYAVLLVAAGAAWRHAGTRLLGIGLVGLVVLKLYLYDVWLLAPFYRMTAFAILGALLLVVSYLYSRRARSTP
jgi:hypothetical protein